MCTYTTEKAAVLGSAKGADGWFSVQQAVVYLDHPFHSPYEHTLNIDLVDVPDGAAGKRVAVEATPESARRLVACIETALASMDGVDGSVQAGR